MRPSATKTVASNNKTPPTTDIGIPPTDAIEKAPNRGTTLFSQGSSSLITQDTDVHKINVCGEIFTPGPPGCKAQVQNVPSKGMPTV